MNQTMRNFNNFRHTQALQTCDTADLDEVKAKTTGHGCQHSLMSLKIKTLTENE